VSLSSGQSCTVSVDFTPTIIGVESATLVITPGTGPALTDLLIGQGVAPTTDTVTPSTLNFGNIVQGASSLDQIVTITNTGTLNPLVFTFAAIFGPQAADFTIASDTCVFGSAQVYPGMSCQIALVFTPQPSTSPNEDESATLAIRDNANGVSQSVNLIGQGTHTAVSYSVFSQQANPGQVNFGDVPVGTISAPQIVTVENTAHGPNENNDMALLFPGTGAVTITGTNASEFMIQNDLCTGASIDPPGVATSDTCTVDVVFAPVAPNGPAYAFLTFFPKNGSGAPQQIELIGNGVQPGSLSLGLAANGLDFGIIPIHQTSPTKTVVITNTSSTANLVITNLVIVGPNAPDFAIVQDPGTCGAPFPTTYPIIVQIGTSCKVDINFTPSALGDRFATLDIVDNTPESPDQVSLHGIGGIPEQGYWMIGDDGDVFAFGAAHYFGGLGNLKLNKPIVGMAATIDGNGYWVVASDGGIFTFGNAQYYGSTGGIKLNKPIVGMAVTPTGHGYWLVASDGGIFSFGDAIFYGSTGSIVLNKPIVAMTKTPDGKGYLLVATDGGVFCFGDAAFHGSAANYPLNKPINGLVVTPAVPSDPTAGIDSGYLLSAADGGLFAFGNAAFMGSAASLNLKEPIVGIMSTPDFGGYWQVGNDGGVFSFGDAQFHGSVGDFVAVVPNIKGLAADPVTGSEVG